MSDLVFIKDEIAELSEARKMLSIGETKKEAQLTAILSFIDEGCDELLIRRIWERAMRAGL